ncbi:MAG: glycosyltransferase, partial [Pseudomonadota bacterium]
LSAFDFVVDVRGLDDTQLAKKISEDCIDVLIDLKGWTSGSHSSALALRAAPVQIQWLGYPGTMGAAWIDYMIADRVLIRDGDEQHYAEKIIFLPDSYQPNDRKRTLSAPPSREQLGLPESALVLACFNQAYKITKNVLLVWIDVLRRVSHAVLWLLEDNVIATEQIRSELSLHGIEAHRLIMAPRLHADQHLARIQQADLALDCSPCGSHTTASDMLWAGVPLVALSGDTFASRVSESLLRAAWLPELVASNLSTYAMLILNLANQPAKLLAYRQRLSRQRLTAPLFDSRRFVRHLESGLLSAWKNYEEGRLPDHIDVKLQPIVNIEKWQGLKIAVVTPYWRIAPEKLMRCIETVRQQTIPVTHFLVADGESVSVPDEPDIVHVILPENVGNKGAAPRGIGAQLAFNQGFDVVAFLDADNWFDADHIARAVSELEQNQLDVVFARRRIIFPDGEILSVPLAEDESGSHVDTNCYVISKRASFLAGIWAMFPKVFGSGEDRLPLQVIRHLCLRSAYISHPTVWYESNWGVHYKLAGKRGEHALRVNSRSVGYHFDPEVYFQHTGVLLPIDSAKDAEPISHKHPSDWRVAVVTPYQGEAQPALLNCIQSVSHQGLDIAHFIVSSEQHSCKVEAIGVRHWALPGQYTDHGNTSRGVAAIFAFQLGYDAVLFLNADNVLSNNYIQHVLSELEVQSADVVVSAQSGSVFVTKSAAYLGMLWAQLPVSSLDNGVSLFYSLAKSVGAGIVNIDSALNYHKSAVDEYLDSALQTTSCSAIEIFQRTGRFLLSQE